MNYRLHVKQKYLQYQVMQDLSELEVVKMIRCMRPAVLRRLSNPSILTATVYMLCRV